jgi:hypothetical protein
MKIDKANVLAKDLLTVSAFVALLKARENRETISNATIHHHLDNTDNLDYVDIDGTKFIVNNEKAKGFTVGSNYSKKDTRTMNKLRL